MKRILRITFPLLIPVLSLVYAFGAYCKWWDYLSGRTVAAHGLRKLASPSGYPETIIFDDEPEFKDLLNLILCNTDNHKAINLHRKGTSPSAIVRVGGTLRPEVGDKLPEGWPNPKFAPASSPVAFAYNYFRPGGRSISKENIEPIANLGDLRQWINDSRNRERFIVSCVLIGLLSIVVVVLDVTRSRKEQS